MAFAIAVNLILDIPVQGDELMVPWTRTLGFCCSLSRAGPRQGFRMEIAGEHNPGVV